jgi:protein tyrosine kinase modulator
VQSGSEFSFRNYIQVIFKRKWYFIVPFLTITSIAVASIYFIPKVYMSYCTINISRNILPILAVDVSRQLQVWQSKIHSPREMREVVDTLELDRRFSKREDLIAELTEKMINNTSISIQAGQIIRMTFKGRDPQKVQEVLEVISNKFVENIEGSMMKEAVANYETLSAQAKKFSSLLEEANNEYMKFQQDNIDVLPGKGTVNKYLSLRDQAQANIKKNIQQQKVTQTIIQTLKSQLQGIEEKHIEKKEISNPELDLELENLKILNDQFNKLSITFTPQHPRIKSLKNLITEQEKKIAKIRESIQDKPYEEVVQSNPVYEELRLKLASAEVEKERLKTEYESLKVSYEDYEEKAKKIPANEKELNELQMALDNARSQFIRFSSEKEKAYQLMEKVDQENLGNLHIQDPASKPRDPVEPNPDKIILLGLMLAFVTGIGAIFLVEYLDHSLRSADEVRRFVGIPVLGTVSVINTKRDLMLKKAKIVVFVSFLIVVLAGAGYAGYKFKDRIKARVEAWSETQFPV